MKILLIGLFLSGTVWSVTNRQMADLHNHMFGHEAWDGGWFHGRPDGPEHEALHPCTGNDSFFGDHGVAIHPWLTKLVFKTSDTGAHGKQGYPNYTAWPRWDTVAHQQLWEGHLKVAHQSGLRFMIVSFYNNDVICSLMRNKARYTDCDDMSAVDRQFSAYENFLKGHDEGNVKKPLRSTWVVHANTAEEAKKFIKEGKLVLIPSIEVSNLFPSEKGDWRVQLQKYYDRGLRTLQIVHQFNNRFAGAALHDEVLRLGQIVQNKEMFDETNGFNNLGLTKEGEELVKEMMKKKMLLDIAHVSEKTVFDVKRLTTQEGHYYPVYNSHTHTRTMMDGLRAKYEKSSSDSVLEYTRDSGGIIGLRTGNDPTHAFEAGKKVANDCQGTTKSFAQSYLYLDQKLKLPMAFGSDLNGFITQIKPRFGADSNCQSKQFHPLKKAFDETGYGHIGQIGDIIEELQNFGVDVTNISNSAKVFIEMWEKSEVPAKRNKVLPGVAKQ